MIPADLAGGGMEMAGPAVIAESLPGMQNLALGGGSEGREIGEAPEPFLITRRHGGHGGLLQHELGDENGVGIARPAPGQITSVARVPASNRFSKGADFLMIDQRRKRQDLQD